MKTNNEQTDLGTYTYRETPSSTFNILERKYIKWNKNASGPRPQYKRLAV